MENKMKITREQLEVLQDGLWSNTQKSIAKALAKAGIEVEAEEKEEVITGLSPGSWKYIIDTPSKIYANTDKIAIVFNDADTKVMTGSKEVLEAAVVMVLRFKGVAEYVGTLEYEALFNALLCSGVPKAKLDR